MTASSSQSAGAAAIPVRMAAERAEVARVFDQRSTPSRHSSGREPLEHGRGELSGLAVDDEQRPYAHGKSALGSGGDGGEFDEQLRQRFQALR